MRRINRSVLEQRICAPTGGTWPGETPDRGQGEQRAHQPTGLPSSSGLEPPVLTRFLGLDRGPRLLPNDGEGTRIRTTSRTVRAGRGSTKACGCGHAPKKGTQGPGASALPAAPPRGPAGTRREPPSTVAQTQLTATGSAGAGSALSGSPRGLRCGGEQNPRKPQLGAKGTGLVETGADQVQTARARGHVVLFRQLSQGNRSAHLYSLSTTPSQSSLVLQTQDVNSV